jgi:hypothetical protein
MTIPPNVGQLKPEKVGMAASEMYHSAIRPPTAEGLLAGRARIAVHHVRALIKTTRGSPPRCEGLKF